MTLGWLNLFCLITDRIQSTGGGNVFPSCLSFFLSSIWSQVFSGWYPSIWCQVLSGGYTSLWSQVLSGGGIHGQKYWVTPIQHWCIPHPGLGYSASPPRPQQVKPWKGWTADSMRLVVLVGNLWNQVTRCKTRIDPKFLRYWWRNCNLVFMLLLNVFTKVIWVSRLHLCKNYSSFVFEMNLIGGLAKVDSCTPVVQEVS